MEKITSHKPWTFQGFQNLHAKQITFSYQVGHSNMGAIQSFFEGMLDIIKSLIIIAKNVALLILQPGKALLFILCWIIGIPIYAVLLINYMIFDLPILNYLQFINYYFWTVLVFDLIVSLFYFALFCVYGVIACGMWLTDLLSFGLVRLLTRCENDIHSWYTRANFAYGNTANRLLIAQLPCARKFKPNGFVCERQPIEEPSYCPHSQIYRIYKGMKVHSPPIIDKFNPSTTSFMSANPGKREEMVRAFFRSRKDFIAVCATAMTPFQNIVRSICANPKTANIESEKYRDLLKPLCLQAFCSGVEGTTTAPFCDMLSQNDKDNEDAKKEQGVSFADIAKKMAMLAIVLVMLTIAMVLYASDRQKLAAMVGLNS